MAATMCHVQRAREWTTQKMELKHVILDMAVLVESHADSYQKVQQELAKGTKRTRQTETQDSYQVQGKQKEPMVVHYKTQL